MIYLIDNGHGSDTPGKRSPDGRLREYEWTRRAAALIVRALRSKGRDARLLVPESRDVPLSERCRRVNEVCRSAGPSNCLLVSIHVNAAGADGKWHNASGFSAWACPQASATSRRLAAKLQKNAEALGLKGNRAVPASKYWEAGFYILRYSRCPAVLSECLFQDNRADVDLLLSDDGVNRLVDLHVKALIDP